MSASVSAPSEVMVTYALLPEPAPPALDGYIEILSAAERGRAKRFLYDRDRRLYIAAHALLRLCLRGASGRADWAFRTNEFGRPELAPSFGDPPLRFSLSHTAGLVCCALGWGHDIGLDGEAVREIDREGLARRFFAAPEIAPCRDRFFEVWTMKEAVVKAMGGGLSIPLRQFAVALDPPSVTFDPVLRETDDRWLLDRRGLARHHMALAVGRRHAGPVRATWRQVRL